MARSRNIKPGFFANDILAECSPLARLLFIGLWTIADREGRLEDRPKRIKGELFPYDNCNIDKLLNELAEKIDCDGSPSFIIRYIIDNKGYIQIVNFVHHQNPHIKEAASVIPAPDKHQTSTRQALTLNQTSHADSLLPITDSLLPITDSLLPITDTPPVVKNTIPYREIVNLYHELCPGLPRVMKISEARKKHIGARWRQTGEHLIIYKDLFSKVGASDFLNGKSDNGWKADFDWLMNEANMVKVLEDKYINKKVSFNADNSGDRYREQEYRG